MEDNHTDRMEDILNHTDTIEDVLKHADMYGVLDTVWRLTASISSLILDLDITQTPVHSAVICADNLILILVSSHDVMVDLRIFTVWTIQTLSQPVILIQTLIQLKSEVKELQFITRNYSKPNIYHQYKK